MVGKYEGGKVGSVLILFLLLIIILGASNGLRLVEATILSLFLCGLG